MYCNIRPEDMDRITTKELAEAFIDDYSESSTYCNLFEARQLDY